MKMEAQIRLINVENIIPNRFQPRLTFDQDGLNELAASIREHGIIQPLVVRRVKDKYEIIAGERRYKAAQMAGLNAVPAIISDLDDNESAEVAILENTHRRNLSAIEEAKSYKKLLDRNYVTQDQLASRLGTSQSNIANKIRLLSLDETVQDALLKNKISERHARSLLKVTDKFKQVDLLNKIIEEKWTVRYLDEEISKILGTYNKNQTTSGGINANSRIDIDINSVEENSKDLEFEDLPEYTEPEYYEYESKRVDDKKKSSMFFNDLENESVNMDPTLSFGFNPFKKQQVTIDNAIQRDYELLELDDTDDKIEDPEYLDEKVENSNVEIKEVVKEREYCNMDEVIVGIKDVYKNARKNEVSMTMEEFSFDDYYQFVIRIDKNKEEKK